MDVLKTNTCSSSPAVNVSNNYYWLGLNLGRLNPAVEECRQIASVRLAVGYGERHVVESLPRVHTCNFLVCSRQ